MRLILILLFSTLCTFSQEEINYSLRLETKGQYGFIIPHRTGMKNLITGHVKALEFNYDIPTFGDKMWEQIYQYPSWGLSWYLADLANPDQLGFATGVYPYLRLYPVKNKSFLLSYHLGWGFGYLSKSFSRVENYKNIAIGSKLNAIIGLGAECRFKISQHTTLSSGISFTHFSNGAYKMPNLGINIPAVSAGISYALSNRGKTFRTDTIPPVNKRIYVSYTINGGMKSIYPSGSKGKYPAFTFNASFGKERSHKHLFLTSIDVFYNTALLKYYKKAGIDLENNFENFQTGISFCYMARVSKVHIITGMGAYIYTKYKLDGPFYHRIGMRYQISEKIFANLTLKTHFFKADFSEWGIGYRL